MLSNIGSLIYLISYIDCTPKKKRKKKNNNNRKKRLTQPVKKEHSNLCYTIVLNSDHSVVKFEVYEFKRLNNINLRKR